MKRSLFIAAFLALLGATAIAQPAAQPAANDEEVVVTAERLHTVLREFVGSLSAPPTAENQLGRWENKICPAVIGLTHASEAQAIIDRIALRAHQIGLNAEASGCRANLVVFVTSDAGRLAEGIVRNMNDWVHSDSHTRNTLGQAELAAFIGSTKPVRWWHVLETVGADGQRIADAIGGSRDIPGAVSAFAPPGLLRATRQDFRSVLVIVDSRQAQGYGLDSLGDYVAMVSLAQLRADADTSAYPSILNLFSATNAPRAMTDWDLAYLNGLYHAQRDALSARRQEGEIADRMTQTLRDNDHSGDAHTDAPH
jgi:hypothetical protein